MSKSLLSAAQLRMLDRVVRTNGGGLSVYSIDGRERAILRRLEDADLIQGEQGQQYMAVHTKEGLQRLREIQDA